MIVGGEISTGGADVTLGVGSDAAGALVPPAFFAVSSTTMVCPTSAAVSLCVCSVAPEISVHAPPVSLKRSHW